MNEICITANILYYVQITLHKMKLSYIHMQFFMPFK